MGMLNPYTCQSLELLLGLDKISYKFDIWDI